MIGTSKAWFCGQDGSVYELTGGSSGGNHIPEIDTDFTYSGEYQIIDDSDVSNPGDWRIKFLTSGNLVFKNNTNIDLFLVGGGGAGGASISDSARFPGGGGGYTKTVKNILATKQTEYKITVGDGATPPSTNSSTQGGTSSAFGNSVDGGYTAINGTRYNNYVGSGGDGGSGGGGYTDVTMSGGSNGGSNGSNGTQMYCSGTTNSNFIGMGTGQGSTTREFGEESGDLYAGGGGGGGGGSDRNMVGYGGEGGGGNGGETLYMSTTVVKNATSGTANTGGGGGGSSWNPNGVATPGSGGSGIVVIRNSR